MEFSHTPEGWRRILGRSRLLYPHTGISSDNESALAVPAQARSRDPKNAFQISLLRLPSELQLLILSYLDFGDIERLRRTNSGIRRSLNKATIRTLFPNLKDVLLSTCYLCLVHKHGMDLIRAEESDARYPLASRCFDCVAQRSGFMVGRKYMLGNSASVWVCRWCGYPVSTIAGWNQPEFHVKCFQKYNRILLLYFLLGCAQWAVVIIAAALCWHYFRHSKMVLGPTIVNFVVAFWVFGLSVLRGAVLRTYHWAFVLELAIMALWIPPVYAIAEHISKSPNGASKATMATLAFIGINMFFRFLNAAGNFILLCEWKMWRRNKPRSSLMRRFITKTLTILVFWADPQSMEQDYPATWWFRGSRETESVDVAEEV
ncbi:hypothetical protein PT974_00134 [Cladobotryum mycophilum]|uniref:F-box domain-containing protein n=1 Tax=Cladobotryum mycophilum TaxID=491253 RepID=A0ABR0T0L3_9HYPO